MSSGGPCAHERDAEATQQELCQLLRVPWLPDVDVWAHVRHAVFDLVRELDRRTERLARIGQEHQPAVEAGGLTSGMCSECGWAHPCPTNVWATTDRDSMETWDPADDEKGG